MPESGGQSGERTGQSEQKTDHIKSGMNLARSINKCWAECPRCGYHHTGPSATFVKSEARRCEKICQSHNVPLKAWVGNERDRGDREALRK